MVATGLPSCCRSFRVDLSISKGLVAQFSITIEPDSKGRKAAPIFFRPSPEAAARIDSLCQRERYTVSQISRWLIAKGWEAAFGEDINAPIVVPPDHEKTP